MNMAIYLIRNSITHDNGFFLDYDPFEEQKIRQAKMLLDGNSEFQVEKEDYTCYIHKSTKAMVQFGKSRVQVDNSFVPSEVLDSLIDILSPEYFLHDDFPKETFPISIIQK